jgi:hypothetical protein
MTLAGESEKSWHCQSRRRERLGEVCHAMREAVHVIVGSSRRTRMIHHRTHRPDQANRKDTSRKKVGRRK